MNIDRKILMQLLVLAISLAFFSKIPANAQERNDLQEVQQIVAIVNDDVISLYDLKQRATLIVLLGGQRQLSLERRQFIQNQAMDALIDDRLKIQEAETFEAVTNDDTLAVAFVNYAGQLNMEPEQLERALEAAGVEKDTLLAQMRGTLSWSALVQGLLQPLVNVTDDEVLNYIEKMERDKGKFQYNLSEIFILVTDNERREESLETANLISEQLKSGTPFRAVAQQFSQSSTAAVGGDLGWMMVDELSDEFAEVIPTMEVGQISEPIQTEEGIYIVQLDDRSRILELNEADIAVDLKFLHFNRNEESGPTLAELNERVFPDLNKTDTCELIEQKAETLGAELTGDMGRLTIGDLPINLRQEILSLELGAGTNLIDDELGYRSFVLCAKNIPEVTLPDFDTVLENLTNTRLQLLAKRHLRDLRRDAIVDYR